MRYLGCSVVWSDNFLNWMLGNCLWASCFGVERSWREGLAGFYIAIFITINNNIKQTLGWDGYEVIDWFCA